MPIAELRRAFANCPPVDYAAMRAEMDALFGEDRVATADLHSASSYNSVLSFE